MRDERGKERGMKLNSKFFFFGMTLTLFLKGNSPIPPNILFYPKNI